MCFFTSNGETLVSHVDEETTKLVKSFFALNITVERAILERATSRVIIARFGNYVFVLSSYKAPNLGTFYLEFNKALNKLRDYIENKTILPVNNETVTIPRVRTEKREEQEAWNALINIKKPTEKNPPLITRETVFSKNTTLENLIDSPDFNDLKNLNDWVLIFYMLLNGEKTLEQVAQEIGQSIENVTKLSHTLLKMKKIKIKST